MQDISYILAEKMTGWLEEKNNNSETELVVIKYGLQLLIENVMMLIFLIGVAVLTNKVYESFLVIGVFSLLRINAGGIHMHSSYGCSMGMLIVWVVGVYGSTLLKVENEVICGLLVLVLIALILYAPGDTRNNPITDNNIRRRKKIASILTVIALSPVILLTNNYEWKALILIPIILEIITILPIVNYINQKRLKEDV